MTHRRDFLRALALGTGAILIGRGWYKPGQGLIVPPEVSKMWIVSPDALYFHENGVWRVVEIDREAPSITISIEPPYGLMSRNAVRMA